MKLTTLSERFQLSPKQSIERRASTERTIPAVSVTGRHHILIRRLEWLNDCLPQFLSPGIVIWPHSSGSEAPVYCISIFRSGFSFNPLGPFLRNHLIHDKIWLPIWRSILVSEWTVLQSGTEAQLKQQYTKGRESLISWRGWSGCASLHKTCPKVRLFKDGRSFVNSEQNVFTAPPVAQPGA